MASCDVCHATSHCLSSQVCANLPTHANHAVEKKKRKSWPQTKPTLKNHRTVACLIYLQMPLIARTTMPQTLWPTPFSIFNFLGEDQDAQTEVQSVVNTGKQPVRGSLHGDRSWLVSWSRWGKILSIRSIKAVRQNRCQAAKTEREGGREGGRERESANNVVVERWWVFQTTWVDGGSCLKGLESNSSSCSSKTMAWVDLKASSAHPPILVTHHPHHPHHVRNASSASCT